MVARQLVTWPLGTMALLEAAVAEDPDEDNAIAAHGERGTPGWCGRDAAGQWYSRCKPACRMTKALGWTSLPDFIVHVTDRRQGLRTADSCSP